jgi:hypothetical protein
VIVVVMILHPLAWYVQHRFILHSQWSYKVRCLAATWKRLHYDHHQNPTMFEGMMGPLRITLPAVTISSIAEGATIGGTGIGRAGQRGAGAGHGQRGRTRASLRDRDFSRHGSGVDFMDRRQACGRRSGTKDDG